MGAKKLEYKSGGKMLGVIIVIIVVGIVVLNYMSKKREEERKEAEKQERIRKKKELEAQQKAKYEVVTESEKQQWLSIGGQDFLDTTLKMFEDAVNGKSSAMVAYGIIYGPHGKMKNADKSFYWMNKARATGDSEAMYWLALYYLHGFGVTQNKVHGTSLMFESAAKGNKNALKSLREDYNMSDSQIREATAPFRKV